MKGKGESKTGYYSSHGVMVPMGPAATTDGSQYLGRPRRYKYDGSSGQPTMSADSGFSSVDGIARINRGYEDEACPEPMFPEQVEDDESDEDLYFLKTRKLPIYSLGTRPRRRVQKLNPLKEGFIPDFIVDAAKSIGLSAPGVDILIGKLILDREAAAGNEAIDEMCSIIGIDAGHLAAAVMDHDDDPMVSIIQVVCNLDPQDRLNARDYFREFLEALKDAISTIVQAYDSAIALVAGQLGPQAATPEEIVTIPAVNFISGLSGFFVRSLPIERLVFDLSSRLAQMFAGVMDVSGALESASPEYGEAMRNLEDGFGPLFSALRQNPAISLSRLGTLYSVLKGDNSLCMVEELPVSEEAQQQIEDVEAEEEIPEEEADISDENIPIVDFSPATFPEAEGCACPISEARFHLLENRYNMIMRNLGMSELTLREFVREMIKESSEEVDDRPSRYGGEGYLPSDVLPYGSEYISPEEHDEREDISDEYIVSYRGDDDYTAYSARPVSLKERALRRIIQKEVKKILDSKDDSKKKDKEEDEIEEFSGASAAGGGPVTPLGTGPDGGIDHDHKARERSIYANERGFGGGKRSSTWMTYPIKGY